MSCSWLVIDSVIIPDTALTEMTVKEAADTQTEHKNVILLYLFAPMEYALNTFRVIKTIIKKYEYDLVYLKLLPFYSILL